MHIYIVPQSRKQLEMGLDEKADQAVLTRCRACPDKCADQPLFTHKWPLLSCFPLFLHVHSSPDYLDPPPFPTSGSSPECPIKSLVPSQNVLPQHPTLSHTHPVGSDALSLKSGGSGEPLPLGVPQASGAEGAL